MWTLYSVHYIVYIIKCTLYSVHYTVYIIQCTLHSVQSIMYIVQCTIDTTQLSWTLSRVMFLLFLCLPYFYLFEIITSLRFTGVPCVWRVYGVCVACVWCVCGVCVWRVCGVCDVDDVCVTCVWRVCRLWCGWRVYGGFITMYRWFKIAIK